MTHRLLSKSLLVLSLVSCSSSDTASPSKDSLSSEALQISLPRSTNALASIKFSSYWTVDSTQQAAESFANREYQVARDLFEKSQASSPEQEARLKLMVALCDSKLGQHKRAAAGFAQALRVMPDLSDFLNFSAARSYFFAHDSDKSMHHARSVDAASIHGADAELLIGDLLRGKGEARTTFEHYQNYLESRKTPIRQSEARYRLAQAAIALGNPLIAAQHLKRIRIEAPLSVWATRATKLSDATVPQLAPKDAAGIADFRAQDFVTRGHVYYTKMRNEKSEADFASALTAPGLDTALHCDATYHRANSVYKQRNRTKAAPLFLLALASCEAADNADLYVKAAYQAGRSFATLGQRETAIGHYKTIEDKHPEHSYADDARLLQAEEYEKLGNTKKAKELLSSIPEIYPTGDMAAESLWRLAWQDYKAKNYKGAIVWLKTQIEVIGIDDHFWAEGQALYWLARAQGKLGKTKESIAAYRQVIRDYPLSYYSLLALNRLRESHKANFKEAVTEIRSKPTSDSNDGIFRFRERKEYTSIAFARAIEFLRLGLPDTAAAELSRIGFTPPKGRERLDDDDAIDKTWAVSYLHNSIGNFGRALWSTRWHILDYKRHWPVSGWKKRWQIAYPPGYWDLIDKYAKQQNIPTELAMSFVREESSFDPTQESFANAIGLSQLIMPTARRFAEGTGIEVSRKTLRNPDNNIQIGTRFMSFLMTKWDKQLSLIPPSYNAGETAVAKWMKVRASWDRDAFAEEIPYDETRRYSKRVLASYFAYRYLLHDEIPEMPNQF